MKKTIISAALATMIYVANAQPYFKADYSHSTSFNMNSAFYSRLYTRGFVMAGLNSTGGVPNFVVDKTDPNGTVGPNSWSAEFKFQWPNNCTGANVDVTSYNNFSMIEIDSSTHIFTHALAMVNSTALYFGVFDYKNLTGPNGGQTLMFPPGASFPTKPFIVPGVNPAQSDYYVCGSYYDSGTSRTYMYLLNLQATGGLLSEAIYDLGTGTRMIPSSILLSPYSNFYTGEIVISGTLYDPGTAEQGFVMFIDPTNFSANTVKHYGGSTTTEMFSTMEISNSGTPGYLFGGYDNSGGLSNSTSWLVKTNPAGGIIWSKDYQIASISSGEVVSIVERRNPAGGHSIFGLVGNLGGGNSGMEVIRVDANGAWYTTNPNNDYYYTGSTASGVAVKLDYQNTGSSAVGLHVFGQDNSDFHLVSAYFNGVAGGCESIQTQANSANGPNNFTTLTNLPASTGFNPCNADLHPTPANFNHNVYCGGGSSYPSGSNSKITSIQKNIQEKASLYPNPTNGILNIEYDKTFSGKTEIIITDAVGKIIYQSIGNEKNISLNLKDLGIKPGLYFLKTTFNGNSTNEKILYREL